MSEEENVFNDFIKWVPDLKLVPGSKIPDKFSIFLIITENRENDVNQAMYQGLTWLK